MEDPQVTIDRCVKLQEGGLLERGSLAEALVLFYKWLLAEQCIIRDAYADQIPLIPYRAQRLVLAKAMKQACQGKPVRLVILKSRKVGISTLVQALFFFLCGHYPNRIAKTLAHEAGATQEIFDITRLISEAYEEVDSDASQRGIAFTGNRSQYYCRTAGGHGVGAGGTPNYLHLSEVAKWLLRKEENDISAINAVPDTNPDTIIIYESTAKGREMFWDKFDRAGDPTSPYDQVFIPWYIDDRLKAPIAGEFELTSSEWELVNRANRDGITLTKEHLQWRRNKIKATSEDSFRQEFPSTPEEAVQASHGIILPGMRSCIIETLPFNFDLTQPNQRVGGIDHGFFDATVIISAVTWDQVLYVYDIYHEVQKLSEDHVMALIEATTYYMDPSAVAGREELKREIDRKHLEVQVLQAPRIKGECGMVKEELRRIRNMINEGKLKVLRHCSERLLIEADNYLWNPKTGEPNDTRTIEAGHYDVLAALRYLVSGVTVRERAAQKKQVLKREPIRRFSRRMALRSV